MKEAISRQANNLGTIFLYACCHQFPTPTLRNSVLLVFLIWWHAPTLPDTGATWRAPLKALRKASQLSLLLSLPQARRSTDSLGCVVDSHISPHELIDWFPVEQGKTREKSQPSPLITHIQLFFQSI